MYPATSTKLNPEERKAIEAMAKDRKTTVSAILREAVKAYIGLSRPDASVDPRLPGDSMRLLKTAASDTGHPLHDVAYGLLFSPRSLGTAYS